MQTRSPVVTTWPRSLCRCGREALPEGIATRIKGGIVHERTRCDGFTPSPEEQLRIYETALKAIAQLACTSSADEIAQKALEEGGSRFRYDSDKGGWTDG